MFFTVRKIDGFVINIDDFENDDPLFTDVLALLRPSYKLAFTSQKGGDFSRFGIAPADVFSAQSFFELSMYQNVFRRAINKLGTVPSSTVYICRNYGLLRHAHELLLGTIVMMPPGASDTEKLYVYQEFPDFVLNSVAELKESLCGGDVGFGGEYSAAPPGVFIFSPAGVRTCRFPNVPNTEHPDCPVYVAGRYFGYSDPRHKLHALSTRIVTSKRKPEGQAKCFADLFIRGAWWASGGNIDYITRVPSRPSETDRLLLYMDEIPNSATFKTQNLDPKILRTDLLQCNVKYPKLKTLNYQQRKEAVKGAFQASPDVAGKRIVLLDDVQTTGATLNECIHMLKNAGAQSVMPLVLGYHPYALQTLGLTDDHELRCHCNSTLIGRCNNTGDPFFGCSGWKPGQNHATRNFLQGVTDKLKLMEPHLLQMDEELKSENIGF
ncbi:hypothetical protein BH10CYA1_BH10CYA1_62160 [soil metagenome]